MPCPAIWDAEHPALNGCSTVVIGFTLSGNKSSFPEHENRESLIEGVKRERNHLIVPIACHILCQNEGGLSQTDRYRSGPMSPHLGMESELKAIHV